MMMMTYFADFQHGLAHVFVRHRRTVSDVGVELGQPLAVPRDVLGEQQLRRWRFLHRHKYTDTMTQTDRQTDKQTNRDLRTQARAYIARQPSTLP